MSKNVVIAGACRTPIGSMGGSLSKIKAAELGSIVIEEAVKRAGINPSDVNHVYMGNVIQAGQGMNTARQAAVNAGIPNEVPAVTVNVVCGSGLNSVNMAAHMIKAGEADVVVAGGMENMSMAPYFLENARFGYRLGNGELKDSMITDTLWDAFNDYHMGITAENIVDKWNLTREELDEFAFNSQIKAAQALNNKAFEEEIVPVVIKGRKNTITFAEDEGVRADSSLEKMAALRSAFKKEGKVTAANSSTINDGAAAVIVMSEEKAKELGVKPQAFLLGGDLAGVDPSIMGIGPVAASNKTLSKLNMTIDDMDLIEANEAFAAQAIAVQRELNIPDEKLNVNGGAIALGHPVGASGARILVSLIYEMKKRNAGLGLATLCIGGGMGCSAVIKSM